MSSMIKSKDVANLSDVLTVLEPLETKWHKFGVHLRIQKEVLDRFEKDYKGTERHLTEVISHWQKNNQPTWEKLASAVEKVGSHDNLVKEIRKLAAFEARSQESDADNNSEDDKESGYDSSDLFDTSSLSPGCGCGECDVHKMCTEGCPEPDDQKHLPILTKFNGRETASEKSSSLSLGPDSFEEETKRMCEHFGNLVTDICQSLISKKQDVDVVAVFLLSSFPILKKKADEIIRAKNIAGLFKVVSVQACSWFNFDIIKKLIKRFGDAADHKRLAEYEQHFKTYAQQRLPPRLKHVELGSKVGMVGCKKLVIKVDREWESISIAELDCLCREFARILQIERKNLFLTDVNEGCIMLTFMIPQSVAASLSQSQLTNAQKKNLAEESVIRLTCGGIIQWSRRTSSVQLTDSSSDEQEMKIRKVHLENTGVTAPSEGSKPLITGNVSCYDIHEELSTSCLGKIRWSRHTTNHSITVESTPESGDSGAFIQPRPAASIQEDETKKEGEEQPLLDLKKKSASRFPWRCFFIVLSIFIFVLLSVITVCLPSRTHSQVTLMAGDTVECSRANSLFLKSWDLIKSTDKEFDVTFKSVKENELESLQESEPKSYQDYTLTPATTSRRVNIPQGPYIFPYLMTGSNITVSICLDSNATTPKSVLLFIIFADSDDTSEKFKKNKTDSAKNAVFMSLLSVNVKACSNVSYRVRNSAYYYVALEVPFGVRVFNNITPYVVYVNGSSLTQNLDCVLDSQTLCSIRNKLSANRQVLLCYTPPATRSEFLNVHRFFVMMIEGFFICVCTWGVLAVGVVLATIFFVKKCRKNENT